MKKKSLLLLLTAVLLLGSMGTFAATHVDAVVSPQKVTLDGKDVSLGAYNIQGENYVKLRDVAALFMNTEAKFNVIYDQKANTITLVEDGIYTKIKGDLAPLGEGTKKALPTTQKCIKTEVDHPNELENLTIKAFNIDGHNYFRLRDLGDAVDFGVAYNYKTNSVILDSKDDDIKDILADGPTAFPVIKVYGNPKALDTIELKKFLGMSHKHFEFYDVTHNPKAKSEYESHGGGELPLIVIGETKINGFSQEKLQDVFSKFQ